MRTISRLIAGLCVLGSAACASDGILAPQVKPQSAALAAAVPPGEPAARRAASATMVAPAKFAVRHSKFIAQIQLVRAGVPLRQPLYIVDGVITAATPAELEAMDIMKIEILKDTTPVSYYGTRGNLPPVIVITTRSAPRGT